MHVFSQHCEMAECYSFPHSTLRKTKVQEGDIPVATQTVRAGKGAKPSVQVDEPTTGPNFPFRPSLQMLKLAP